MEVEVEGGGGITTLKIKSDNTTLLKFVMKKP